MTKNDTKTLVFTTLDILQLKKLMIVKIFSVNPLYLVIDHANEYIEEKGVNIWFLTLQIKIKSYLKFQRNIFAMAVMI